MRFRSARPPRGTFSPTKIIDIERRLRLREATREAAATSFNRAIIAPRRAAPRTADFERLVHSVPVDRLPLGEHMGKIIYSANMSLDGYIEDASGSFDWSVPDDDVHQFFNDLLRGIRTHLLGRRMYETMAVWETEPSLARQSVVTADFAAVWQDADKVVYSTTLTEPKTTRTRIVRAFDGDEVRSLKQASSADLLVSGPGLAGHALRAGVVDELHMVIVPVSVGAGKPAFPTDLQLDLELLDQRRFRNGAVHVAYRVRG